MWHCLIVVSCGGLALLLSYSCRTRKNLQDGSCVYSLRLRVTALPVTSCSDGSMVLVISANRVLVQCCDDARLSFCFDTCTCASGTAFARFAMRGGGAIVEMATLQDVVDVVHLLQSQHPHIFAHVLCSYLVGLCRRSWPVSDVFVRTRVLYSLFPLTVLPFVCLIHCNDFVVTGASASSVPLHLCCLKGLQGSMLVLCAQLLLLS